MTAILDLQIATTSDAIPSEKNIQLWLNTVLKHLEKTTQEITVRLVDIEESQSLNLEFRGKDKPTNVLSFPFEMPDIVFNESHSEANEMPRLLGDLVVCSQVVNTEAQQQNKEHLDHWAHMIIHGCLHLCGFDHIEEVDANAMEGLEILLLKQLGIDDPYQDH